MKRILLFGLVLCTSAQAYIPPVAALIRESFDGRKISGAAVEAVLRHRVEPTPGSVFVVEERVVSERGRMSSLVTGGGQAPVALAPERPSVLLAYLLYTNPDGFRDLLIAEGFIRRDNLAEYKPGSRLEGDPATWDLKEIYVLHDNVYLSRLKSGIAYTVEGNGKAIHFDTGLRGVRRLEWREGENVIAWNLDAGFPPKRMTFEGPNGSAAVTEVLAVRAMTPKALADYKNAWRGAGREAAAPLDTVLKVLTGYR